MGGRSGKIRRSKISIEDYIRQGAVLERQEIERKLRREADDRSRAPLRSNQGARPKLSRVELVSRAFAICEAIVERQFRASQSKAALEQITLARRALQQDLRQDPPSEAPVGHPELSLRRAYVREAIDRLKDERGLTIWKASHHVAGVLLRFCHRLSERRVGDNGPVTSRVPYAAIQSCGRLNRTGNVGERMT